MQSNELYIGNLDRNVKSEELRNIFQAYGNVTRSEIKISDKTHNASYGFVAFESAADAHLAKQQVNGIILHNRRMIVQCSKTKAGENRRRHRSIGLHHRESRSSNRQNRSRSRSNNRYRQRSISPQSKRKYRRKTNDHHRKRTHRSRSLSNTRRISLKDDKYHRRKSSNYRTHSKN